MGHGEEERGGAEGGARTGDSGGRVGDGREENSDEKGRDGTVGGARQGKRGREEEEGQGRRAARQRPAAKQQQPPQAPPTQAEGTGHATEDATDGKGGQGGRQSGLADARGEQQGEGAARAGSSVVTAPEAAELAAAEALVMLAGGEPAKKGGASQDGPREGVGGAVGGAGRGRKRKDAAGDALLAAEAKAVWWAKTRAAMCGVLRRVARKRARRAGGERSGGAGGSGAHVAGSKRDASDRDARDGSTVDGRRSTVDGGINGKAPRVEYERRYPTRDIEPERQEGATGPDRPKRKRVDGMACYANSGEGMKRRCDATGRPPGRPPG